MSFLLYNAPQSTCSQRVRFVLNAKQLAVRGGEARPAWPATSSSPTTSRSIPTASCRPSTTTATIVTDSSRHHRISRRSRAASRESFTPRAPVARAHDARAHALHRRDAGRGGAGADLQPRLPAALCGHERGGVSGVRGEQAAAQGIHAGHGAHGLSREGDERGARAHAPHLRAHGRGDCRDSGGPWLLGRTSRSPTSR